MYVSTLTYLIITIIIIIIVIFIPPVVEIPGLICLTECKCFYDYRFGCLLVLAKL